MAADRPALRRTAGLRFAKLLGTGTGRTFTPRDADPRRWGLLAVWDDDAAAIEFEDGPVVRRWQTIADEQWLGRLPPLSAHGRWSGREPFGHPPPERGGGPGAATPPGSVGRSGRGDHPCTAGPPEGAAVLARRAAGLRRPLHGARSAPGPRHRGGADRAAGHVQPVGLGDGAEHVHLRSRPALRRRPTHRAGRLVRRGAVRPLRAAVR